MYRIAFTSDAEKEFLKLEKPAQKLIVSKLQDLKEGKFSKDKPLKGKYIGKFRKRAGNYRIIYYRQGSLLLITILRIAHRKEIY